MVVEQDLKFPTQAGRQSVWTKVVAKQSGVERSANMNNFRPFSLPSLPLHISTFVCCNSCSNDCHLCVHKVKLVRPDKRSARDTHYLNTIVSILLRYQVSSPPFVMSPVWSLSVLNSVDPSTTLIWSVRQFSSLVYGFSE